MPTRTICLPRPWLYSSAPNAYQDHLPTKTIITLISTKCLSGPSAYQEPVLIETQCLPGQSAYRNMYSLGPSAYQDSMLISTKCLPGPSAYQDPALIGTKCLPGPSANTIILIIIKCLPGPSAYQDHILIRIKCIPGLYTPGMLQYSTKEEGSRNIILIRTKCPPE